MNKTLAINEPEHWRQRAVEARHLADQLDDPAAKKTMIEIAKAYDELASLAEGSRVSRAKE